MKDILRLSGRIAGPLEPVSTWNVPGPTPEMKLGHLKQRASVEILHSSQTLYGSKCINNTYFGPESQ